MFVIYLDKNNKNLKLITFNEICDLIMYLKKNGLYHDYEELEIELMIKRVTKNNKRFVIYFRNDDTHGTLCYYDNDEFKKMFN